MWNFLKNAAKIGLMLLGLTGLVDNVVTWYGFVPDILAEYQRVRDLFFYVIPIGLADWAKDYYVIGLAIAASQRRADDLMIVRSRRKRGLSEQVRKKRPSEIFLDILLSVTNFALLVAIWPISLFTHFVYPRASRENPRFQDEFIDRNKHFAQNLGWSLVIFIGFIFVASDALVKVLGT